MDELRKNNVNIDISTLSQYINYILGVHEDLYNEMANHLNSDELLNVFNEMNVNIFGRALAYLALVYRLKDTARVDGSFIRRIFSGVGCVLYEWSIL